MQVRLFGHNFNFASLPALMTQMRLDYYYQCCLDFNDEDEVEITTLANFLYIASSSRESLKFQTAKPDQGNEGQPSPLLSVYLEVCSQRKRWSNLPSHVHPSVESLEKSH